MSTSVRAGRKSGSLLVAAQGVMYIYIMMTRTQIYLTPAIQGALDARAKETGRSRSQLIREALERAYLGDGASRMGVVLAALEASAGAWSGRDDDGEAFVERMRSGELARRHEAGTT